MPVITDLPIWTDEGFEIRTQGNTDTTPATYTYNGTMQSYIFRNDGGQSVTLTIGGNAVTVTAGEMVSGGNISSFTVAAASGTASWTIRAFENAAKLGALGPVDQSTAMKQLTFQTGATGTGNGTPQDVSGYSTLAIRLVITGTATVQFEGSIDGLTYSAVAGYTLSMNNVSSASATNDYRANITGLKMFRVRVSAWTSGTVDATGFVSSLPFTTPSGTLNTAFGNSDVNSVSNLLQGVAAYNLLFDGTNWVRQRMVTNDAGSGNGSAATALIAFNGTNWDRVRSVNTGQLKATLYNSVGSEPIISANIAANDSFGTTSNLLGVANVNLGFNGSTFDRVRIGKVYKYVEYLNLANATATTIWTPSSGKKFRLMAVQVGTSSGSNALVHLRDGVAGSGSPFHTVRTGQTDTKDFDFGNGYISSAANNVLEIYNATGTTCSVWVTAWGTEE